MLARSQSRRLVAAMKWTSTVVGPVPTTLAICPVSSQLHVEVQQWFRNIIEEHSVSLYRQVSCQP